MPHEKLQLQRCGAANGPTSGLPCVLASGPSSAAAPREISEVSLPAWKHVKSGRSRHANGPHSRTPALIAASCTMLMARSTGEPAGTRSCRGRARREHRGHAGTFAIASAFFSPSSVSIINTNTMLSIGR
jgi:hypothetical protein